MKTNTRKNLAPVMTHEGGKATRTDKLKELERTVMTCLLFEDTFYESGNSIADRIASLVAEVNPVCVAGLAVKARDKYQLRHVPLFILSELSKRAKTDKQVGALVESALEHVIQRADELAEFLAIYWRGGKHSIAASVKRGLAAAFTKFNEYQLAKYNRDSEIKLRDVLFMVHAKPKDQDQAALWKRLVDNQLATPDTWEVELSAGKDKKATFERLMLEGKLGGLAVLRNLRNMTQAGVDENIIRERLVQGITRVFPYRFVTAAAHAPNLQDALEEAMFKAVADIEKLPGTTGLLVDVSGSMLDPVSGKSTSSRIDVASGLAILLREKAERVRVATFSTKVSVVPNYRGFALSNAIKQGPYGGTYLRGALETLQRNVDWKNLDRLIVITDEQSADGISQAWAPKSYVINVAPYQHGVSYRNGWEHIDGWSERVFDYIQLVEGQQQD